MRENDGGLGRNRNYVNSQAKWKNTSTLVLIPTMLCKLQEEANSGGKPEVIVKEQKTECLIFSREGQEGISIIFL